MKKLASTHIACPAAAGSKRHAVVLFDDGSLSCDCADAKERGASLAGRLMLGLPPSKDVRGCGALAALVEGRSALLPLARGTYRPQYGSWAELVYAYEGNVVYQAALRLAEQAQPERPTIRKLVLEAVERARYAHSLGKRRFREEFRALWDVPMDEQLDRFIVSAFDDDPWSVPYMPGWKEEIADRGLAVVNDKFVCGRSADGQTLWAICPITAVSFFGDGARASGYWVRPHKLVKKKLVEIAS